MKTKKFVFSLLTVAFSGVGWYFFSVIFNSVNLFRGNGVNWIIFILATALSYAFLFLVALAKDRADFVLTSLLSSLWILVFMAVSPRTLLSAGALFISAQVLWEFGSALSRSLSIKYFLTAYSKIALVILVILGISSAYLQNRVAEGITQESFSQQTSNYAWPYIGKFVSQFNSDQTLDNYLRDQFKAQGISNPNAAMLREERQNVSRQVGFDVNGNEKMSDLGKKFVAYRLGEVLKTYNLNKAGIFVIFFSLLILWPVGRFIFAAIAALVAWIIRKAGWLNVVETQITTKTLEL